ncbi:MAG: hypothetical protein E7391_07130 [Ruminococcaceae bacterium]|nr:hypothetical protein [Oscillospiraceae bacterium]
MNKFLKRTLSAVVAIAMLGCMSVSAAWEFVGYDTSNPPAYSKLYNEVIDGQYTSKHKVEPVAPEDVEWKFEGYEEAYPHAGYERLYLEGNKQNAITRLTNLYPQWETRFCDFMWEVCGEHEIYQRQQTKINNKFWAWDFGNEALGIPDSAVLVPTNRYADVVDSWQDKGVANFDKDGNYVFDEKGNPLDENGEYYNEYLWTIYNGEYETYEGTNETVFDKSMPKSAFDRVINPITGKITKEIVDGTFFSDENLSQLDGDGSYVITDKMIAEKLDIPYTKYVTGPSFYGENPTKDVADMYYDYGTAWKWDKDTAIIENNATIEWTEPVYEMAEPYLYYQYLIVNGLVFDGRNDTPVVYRYTGGKADPKVEWKHFAINDVVPYEVVEVKYIEDNDGKMVMAIEDGAPVVRYPTGRYADSHFVVTDTHVELWVTEGDIDVKIGSMQRNLGEYGDKTDGFTGGAYKVN